MPSTTNSKDSPQNHVRRAVAPLHIPYQPNTNAIFWARVQKSEGCWTWLGCLNDNGYGRYTLDHVRMGAHRASWIIANGPIPEGLFVCHTCDNPPCVNPEHLFLGTCEENLRDMRNKGRWQCRDRSGENSPTAKVDSAKVLEVRTYFARGMKTRQIAEVSGLKREHVVSIAYRHTWKNGPFPTDPLTPTPYMKGDLY